MRVCHRPPPVTTIAMAIGSRQPPREPPIRRRAALIDWAEPQADVTHRSLRQMTQTEQSNKTTALSVVNPQYLRHMIYARRD